jgi:hypothetical protein
MRLTLDTNCLIDLEEQAGQATAITELIKLHRAGKIQLHIGAISASENLPGRVAPETVRQFEARLKRLGIDDLPSVLSTGGYDVAFWGAAVCRDEKDDLDAKIQSILHLTVDTLTLSRTARFVVSDVASLASHIRSEHDIFVTIDQHFLKGTRRQALLALGAKAILVPDAALSKALKAEAPAKKD